MKGVFGGITAAGRKQCNKPKPPAPKPKTPCSKASAGQRTTAAVQGTTNVALAGTKMWGGTNLFFEGLAAAPETGGWSLLASAVGAYGIISSVGQATTGTGQLYTAATGNTSAGQGVQQVGDIMGGPFYGISTLVSTSDPAAAQSAANFESFIQAGDAFLSSQTAQEVIQGGVDFGLSLAGMTGDSGCN